MIVPNFQRGDVKFNICSIRVQLNTSPDGAFNQKGK